MAENIVNKPKKNNSVKKDTYDGSEIDRLVSLNDIDKDLVSKTLGYGEGSKNAYSRLIQQKAPIGLHGLLNLADLLGVEIFDILQSKYKAKIASVKLHRFKNRSELSKFYYELEKAYGGRTALLNSFPSMLYNPEEDSVDSDVQNARYEFLMCNDHIKNQEYYPIRSVLNFGFSDFSSILLKKQKIHVLNQFISAYENASDDKKVVVFTDDAQQKLVCSQFAADCEILGDELLVITAPFYSNAVITIKSTRLVKDLRADFAKSSKRKMKDERVIKMLKILLEVMEKDGSVHDYVRLLKEKESSFYEPVLLMLPIEYQADL